ncbi:MAG: MerC domain-containing protein [Ginsengibacter sp.]
MPLKINWDFMGVATSVACAIHCAVLPVVLSTLPIFGINIIHNLFFEWAMIGIAFFVGIYSLMHGYVRHHRNLFPLSVFLTGFIFLLLKQVFTEREYLFLGIAVLLIITAHLFNYRYCRYSKVCNSSHHKH